MENPQLLPRKSATGLAQRVQSQRGGGESLHIEGPSFAFWTRVESKEWAALVSNAAHKGSGSPSGARPELTLKQLGAGALVSGNASARDMPLAAPSSRQTGERRSGGAPLGSGLWALGSGRWALASGPAMEKQHQAEQRARALFSQQRAAGAVRPGPGEAGGAQAAQCSAMRRAVALRAQEGGAWPGAVEPRARSCGRGGLQDSGRTASPEVMTGFSRCNRHGCRSPPATAELQVCLGAGAEQPSRRPKQPSLLPRMASARTKPHTYKVEALCGACLPPRLEAISCSALSRVTTLCQTREHCLQPAHLPQPALVARARPSSPASSVQLQLAPRQPDRPTARRAPAAPQAPSPRGRQTDRWGTTARSELSAHPSSRDWIVSPPAAASPPETPPPHASPRRPCACAPTSPPSRRDNVLPLISCANATVLPCLIARRPAARTRQSVARLPHILPGIPSHAALLRPLMPRFRPDTPTHRPPPRDTRTPLKDLG